MRKELALIILNWNGSVDTIECLNSLICNKQLYDIYVLDNDSTVEQKTILEEYITKSAWDYTILAAEEFERDSCSRCELSLIKSTKNLGFAVGNNFVAERIYKNYKYVMLLNNDTIVPDNSISNMLEAMTTHKTTALTCDIRYNFDRNILWNAGGTFKWYGDRKYFSQKKIDKLIQKGVRYINAEFITGCALMVECSYIAEYGLLTDKFFHGEEDYNFCYNLRKRKLTVGVDLTAQIFHKVGQSINREKSASQKLRSTIVHYTNRVIDYKLFYGKFHWKIWRNFYLRLVGIKSRLRGVSRKEVKTIKERVKYYSTSFDNVKYEVFTLIMNDQFINLN